MAGKRGRPKKLTTDIIKSVSSKGKRGRPSKNITDIKVEGIENIKVDNITKLDEISDVVAEVYIPPKIERRPRLFRFDKRIYHIFVKKYDGDIYKMSYVFDKLMKMYIDKQFDIKINDRKYYYEWWNNNPSIEPLVENELTASHALVKGIPVQYRYLMVVDPDTYAMFENRCNSYPLYIANEMLKVFVDEKNKINIDITKYREWYL